ncbi:E3 ubiquitin-protein ligase TRIM33-like isoform X2 [Ptychodera flava]|uniref:E3 ubiquitin-protein ligase TRIM33-like isoform X2 n=1 Tax=Ptychodera flava TaxID=63121 RepID=UPI00396A98D1
MTSEASTTVNGDSAEQPQTVCVVCKNGFAGREPKLMPCLHTFCKECITPGDDGAIRCPTCKQEVRNPASLIDNYFMLDEISISGENTTTSTTESETKCTSCDDNATVTSYCDDCSEWLCDACVQAHQRVRVTKDHIIQPKESAEAAQKGTSMSPGSFRERPLMCPLHKQEQLKLYCETCDKLTCRDCQLLGHKEHKYQFVNEAAARQKGTMTAFLQKLEEKKQFIANAHKRIQEKQKQINELENKTSQDIRLFMLTLINEVNRRAKRLLADLKETCAIKKKRLEVQAQEVQQLGKLLDHCMNFTTNTVLKGSNAALLYSKKTILQQLVNVLRIPCNKTPIFGMDIKFLFDMNNATKQISKFGVLLISDASGQGSNPSNVVQQLNRAIQQAPRQAFLGGGGGAHPNQSPPQYGQILYQQQQQRLKQQQQQQQHQQQQRQHQWQQLQQRKITLQQLANQRQQQHQPGMPPAAQIPTSMSATMNSPPTAPVNQFQRQLIQQGEVKQEPPRLSHMPMNPKPQVQPRLIAPKPSPTQATVLHGNPVISNVVSFGNLTRLSPSTLRQLSPSVRDLQEAVFTHMPPAQGNNQVSSASGGDKQLPTSPPTMPVTIPFNQGQQQEHVSSAKTEIKSEAESPREKPSCSFEKAARKGTPPLSTGSGQVDTTGLHLGSSRPSSNASSCDGRSSVTSEPSTSNVRVKQEPMSADEPSACGVVPLDEPSACGVVPLDFTVKRSDSHIEDDDPLSMFPELLDIANPATTQPEKGGKGSNLGNEGNEVPESPEPTAGPSEERANDDESEDYCACCHNGGDLLCCEKCPKVFHLQCHIPSLTATPNDTWICGLCQEVAMETHQDKDEDGSLKRKASSGLDEFETKVCQKILLELFCHKASPPFHEPVPKTVPDYYKIVANPMDLSTIKHKLESYENIEDFISDCRLVFSNCAIFNAPDSAVGKAGKRLDKFLTRLLERYLSDYIGSTSEQPLRFNKRKKRPNEIVHYH